MYMFYVTSISCRRNSSGGFDIPYMLTGQRNLHPRSAMAFLDGPERKDYLKFFDNLE